MRVKVLLLTAFLVMLAAVQAQANRHAAVLDHIGDHVVHSPPLQTKKDLWKMMRNPKVWRDIKNALRRAQCPGTKTGRCSDLAQEIHALFPASHDAFREEKAAEIRDSLYESGSIIFNWMMFRSKGKGKIKVSGAIQWGGGYALPAYEFSIPYKNRIYVFAVPKECGNLALVKRICLP
jgi:hypothetical protein